MSEITQKIIGTWQLVHSVEIDAAGNKHYPFGDDAIGYIIYDAFGKMAVQISRRNRKPLSSEKFSQASTEEIARIPSDYLAYFGGYEIDEKNGLVRHFIEGSLFPNYLGKILERKYHFYDNNMSLKPWDGTNREILWQKN